MAVSKTEGKTSEEIIKMMSKGVTEGVVTLGVKRKNPERIPTGIFPVDLATGGGIPKGRITMLYGSESSMKSTMACKLIASMQRMEPDKKCVFVDAEGTYDAGWASKLGVDNEKVVYVLPDTAEQTVDMMEAFLYAPDISMVVLDSMAALITTNESESSAEKANVGGSALVINKLYRKVTLAMNRAYKEDREPTLVLINQIRMKIGVMFGNPETMPGGMSFQYACSMIIRMYGKDIEDKKLDIEIPAWKQVTGQIKKWKVPIIQRTFEYKLSCVDSPMTGLVQGKCDDWNTISSHLKEMGYLAKKEGSKGGWTLFGEDYPVLTDIKAKIQNDPEFYNLMCERILKTMQTGEIYIEPNNETPTTV